MIKNGFYGPAKTSPSPNKGGHIQPSLIVVHDTAGALSSAGSVAWLSNPAAKASAHFVVGRDGDVTQLISTNLKAWHAGKSTFHGRENVNDFSIGIEIVNPGLLKAAGPASAQASFGAVYDRKKYLIEERPAINGTSTLGLGVTHPAGLWMPYTEKQLAAVLKLCLAIRDEYAITDIAPHWYISPGRKVDTNPLFPLAWLSGKIDGRKNEPVTPAITASLSAPSDESLSAPDMGLCHLHKDAKLRKFPSFFDNEVSINFDRSLIAFTILDNGMFTIEGVDVPPEVARENMHWVKLMAPGFLPEPAWTLFSNIERLA